MHPVHYRLTPEPENVESMMRGTRLGCFVPSRRAPETIFNLAKMSLEGLRKLLGQERALRGRHAVPETEVGEFIAIKVENEEAVRFRDLQPVKRSRQA